MKKRILSLFLALVTVFYILPIGSIPAIALDETEEESYLTIEDMEVGKLYKAEFAGDEIKPWARSPFVSTSDDGKGTIPFILATQMLKVVRQSEEDFGLVYLCDDSIDCLGEHTQYRYVDASKLYIFDGSESFTVDTMEIGKEYKATWATGDDGFAPYRKMDETEEHDFWTYDSVDSTSDGYVSTEGFPEELIIELTPYDEYFVYVTNDNWPEKYDQFRYIKAEVDLLITGEYTPSDDGYIYGKVDIFCEGAVDNVLRLERGKKAQAFTELSSGISANAKFQWEMEIEDGRWAIIPDSFMSYINVSEALIANTVGEYATLRCIVTDGASKYASEELKVQIKPDVNVYYGGANSAQQFADGLSNQPATAADGDFFQANINYKFVHTTREDIHDQDAAVPFIHTFYTASDTLTATIYSPFVMGYTACIRDDENGTIKYGEHSYTAKPLHHFENVNSESPEKDRKITIYYVPNVVNFTVEYYEQNLADDAYTRAGQIRKEGYTDDYIGDKLAVKRDGFKALFYDKEMTIAGNEGTVVEIYYDRIYYLVDFELDGGYGITPYYVKHGTQVMLTEPTKPGHAFKDPWLLTRVYSVTEDELGNKTEEDIDFAADTDLMKAYSDKDAGAIIVVKNNIEYTADWDVGKTSYTIAFWLEDPDFKDGVDDEREKYRIWHTQTVEGANPGDKVDGPGAKQGIPTTVTSFRATIKGDTYTINLFDYLDFIGSDQDVEVKSDGSTVVNVYYDRKEYTLKYYYAESRKASNSNTTTWHVAGMTNPFAESTSNDESKELDCLRNNEANFGRVDKQPTFKAGVDMSKYVEGSDSRTETTDYGYWSSTTTYTYYYISFKAKYGADISDIYPCDIFNTVESQEGRSNGWNDSTAVMSAWTGEYNVLFSRALDNQTMKGKYQILDYQMLWHPSASYNYSDAESRTVSFLAFWENAINTSWNIPELYRYKIWLPTLPGVTYTEKTITLGNGVTYYLADVYDTCDNSQVSEQTQPTLVGFEPDEGLNFSHGNMLANGYWLDTSRGDVDQEELAQIKEISKGQYSEAWIVNYVYSRKSATLSFSNQYDPAEVDQIPYQTDLSVYKTKVPNYPLNVEPGAMYFEGDPDGDGYGDGTGWYRNKDCSLSFSFDTTMTTENIQLYCKWITSNYDVKVYRQESEIGSTAAGQLLYDAVVPFNTQVREEDLATYVAPQENYVFNGWYYKVDGEEKRYDFNTMVIKGETIIYAKWTKNIQIPYTIKYVLRGDGGEIIEIAKQESGFSLAGIQKTFTAKMGSELYDEYDEWYFPQKRYITHIMSENLNENEVFFEYKTSQIIEYSIVHIFQSEKLKTQYGEYFPDGTFVMEIPHKIEMGKDEFETAIIERYNDEVNDESLKNALEAKFPAIKNNEKNGICRIIAALTADYYIQEMVLTLDPSNNVMVFNWFESDQTKTYHVVHYLQDRVISGNDPTYSVYSSVNHTVQNDAEYEIIEEWDNPYGFVRKEVKISGVANNTFLNQDQVEVTLGELGDNLVIEFYYDRAPMTYTIHHYVNGTTQKIIHDEEGLTAYYEDEIRISDVAKTLSGYVLANGGTVKQITTAGDEIICFYDPMTVYYRFQEAISGRGIISKLTYEGHVGEIPDQEEATITATARAGFRFIGWYLDKTGTQSVDQYAVITGVDGSSITPKTPTADMANKTIIFYALFEPTTRVFRNEGVVDENQSFIYRIRGLDTGNSNVDVTFVITGNGSVTLAMLPYGNYEITVLSWSWRYPLPNGQGASTWEENINSPDEYVFAYNTATAGPNNQWLSDDTQGGMAPTADSVS